VLTPKQTYHLRVNTIIAMSLTTNWETRAAAGEPPATVRVNNLTTTFIGPADAWGRPRRPQPLSISAEVAFSRRFSASSSGDVVEADTVHYGLLSKEIQRILADGVEGASLANMLDEVFWRLTGLALFEEERAAGTVGQPFLTASPVLYVGVEIRLPKASLLGDGVSIAGLALMPTDGMAAPRAKSVTLRFHNLRVPTLIGVNANEREAEQMVIANIEVDRWVDRTDSYSPLERVITKVSLVQMMGRAVKRAESHVRPSNRTPI
jgi:dihydroneopterin aldolase